MSAIPCSRRDGETGTIVLWLLGLCVMLLFVGGISTDLWRVLSERRALAGIADAASIAGASALDELAFRTTGAVVLAPDEARARALEILAAQTDRAALTAADAYATPEAITVVIEGAVPLTLMRVLLPDAPDVALRVEATSRPRPDR